MQPEFLSNLFFLGFFSSFLSSLLIFIILLLESWFYRETEVEKHMAFCCC